MNKGGKSDIESNGEIPFAQSESLIPIDLGFQDSKDCQSMYKAVADGNLAAVKELLKRDPSLACRQQITGTGDRALHVAVYKKKTKLVRDLVNSVNDPSELELQDGHGYSACCYAATTDAVEVTDILIEKNARLCSIRNRNGTTPLELAVLYGNKKWALKNIRRAQFDDLLEQDWVKLLHDAVHNKMYGVALEILEKDGSLAVKKGEDQETALHVVAQLDISLGSSDRDFPKMEPGLHKLAKKLWEEIQKLARGDVLELIKNPSILHDAAKFGNVELIAMITSTYPELLGHMNNEGHSIFHIAVMHQQENILFLIKQPENCLRYNAILSEDINGNNLLHLAGKVQPRGGMTKIVCDPDVRMKKRHSWFKEVEKIVPPFFVEKKNKEGYKPIELFWKGQKNLFEESAKHLKSTAESGMLISMIILTVVFAAAFTPPGGYHQETGKPLLATLAPSPSPNDDGENKIWFSTYVIFDVLALLFSTCSILIFASILSSNYEEEQLLSSHKRLKFALTTLLFSLLFAISTFLSAFFLVAWKNEKLVRSFMVPTYVLLLGGISLQFFKLFPRANFIKKLYSSLKDEWSKQSVRFNYFE
ncbi:hypothetical protein C2S53_010562 [Perilla frutescens var. hirtella]|uniref:PGG domain-containing protein n=1 Tax=Perilla frutescens var. hirtella TaxID=608512 RepID=A0AAD4IN15_PERFH|nr:hypothetical protein C2S53_010562 [Perilla frutescens var. hirtella]